jgi:hypothetical protein
MARGHPGASSGEQAAWDILQNLTEGRSVDFGSCLVRLDGKGRHAVLTVVIDLVTGKAGLSELG